MTDDDFTTVDELFLRSVFDAMVLAASCDGGIHEHELAVLKEFLESHEPEVVCPLPTLGPIQDFEFSNIKEQIVELASQCWNHRQQCFFLNWLSKVADADAVLHENESKILAVLAELWGTEIAFSKHIEWTPSQKKVIKFPSDKRVLVEAPPGAGKTAIIAARIEQLVKEQDVEPSNVWLISFTRTAVREMKDRISVMATEYPKGLRVATLDSTAFAMNMALGMSEAHAFSDYECSIKQFVERLQTQDADLMDFLESLEHLIIDEAQDLMGNRRQLCLQLIDKLPEDCGITILGDEFQQIYGNWANSNVNGVNSDTSSLQQSIDASREDLEFERIELSEIHRTSSPVLLSLIEDLRLDLAVYDESAEEHYLRRQEMLKDKISGVSREQLVDQVSDNCLVLYRSTAEVLAASIRLSNASRVFKLRIPRYPRYLAPWVNSIFRYAQTEGNDNLTRDDMNGISAALLSRDKRYFNETCVWDYLLEIASDGQGVSIFRLRQCLAGGAHKHVEFQHPEFGYSGPTIGTVHSSKGRQAEDVFFRMPHLRKSRRTDHGEESRVLFVGASRARENLNLIDGGPDNLSREWKSSPCANRNFKRYIRRYKDNRNLRVPMCFVETGLDGDFDPYSVVNSDLGTRTVSSNQKFLETYRPVSALFPSCFAKYDPGNLCYRVYVTWNGEELQLGSFSDGHHASLVNGSKKVFGYQYDLPALLSQLQIVDVGTHVATRDDQRLQNCVDEYAKRGSWLYPVIFGLGPFRFRHRAYT